MKKRLIFLLIFFSVIIGLAVLFLKNAYVVPVLMYHSIDYNDKTTKLSVSPESFARQMDFLHKNGYNVVGLNEIIPYIDKSKKPPAKTVTITFDDGYYNNYKYAYPILLKYKIPATIFVIVDKIGKPGWLGWKELEEMSNSGLITIGSHTRSHLWLPSLGTKMLRHELADSKKILEDRLGRKVDLLCYPLGAFDDRVKKMAKEVGYSCAVTTNPGRFKPINDIYAIKRIKISRTSDNMIAFWVETSGYYTWIKEHRDE